jgi:ankyrin repeat protein
LFTTCRTTLFKATAFPAYLTMASSHYVNTYTDPEDRFLESSLNDDTGVLEYMEQLTRERDDRVNKPPSLFQTELYNLADVGDVGGVETKLRVYTESERSGVHTPGISLNARVFEGKTAVYIAAKRGHESIVTMLLAANARPDIISDTGHTAVAVAVQEGHNSIVKILVMDNLSQLKDDLYITGHENATASLVHIALINKRTRVLQTLLEYGCDPNYMGRGQPPALGIAISHQYTMAVDLLLNNGANTELLDPTSQISPLWSAVDMSYKTGVELLLLYDADTARTYEIPVFSGHRVPILLLAVARLDADIVEMLLENGAPGIDSALVWQASKNSSAILNVLGVFLGLRVFGRKPDEVRCVVDPSTHEISVNFMYGNVNVSRVIKKKE